MKPENEVPVETDPSPRVSLVVVFGDQPAGLRQALPALQRQSCTEVIVVSHGELQGTEPRFSGDGPSIRFFRLAEGPNRHAAHARNLGAARARGTLLLFLEEALHPDGDPGQWLAMHAQSGRYWQAPGPQADRAPVMVACSKADFMAVGGYDEALRNDLAQHLDLCERLAAAGLSAETLAPAEIGLPEQAASSTENDRADAAAGGLYRQIKRDVLAVSGRIPDLKSRIAMLEHVREKMIRSERVRSPGRIEIRLPPDPERPADFERSLVYTFDPVPTIAAPARRPLPGRHRLGIVILIENEIHDFGPFTFIRLLVRIWEERGFRVSVAKIGSRLPTDVDLAILHVNTTKLDPVLAQALPEDIPVMNRAVVDISKRHVSRMLVERNSDYKGPVIVKSDANYGGKIVRDAAGRDGTGSGIPYLIHASPALVPETTWNDRRLVVEKFTPEIRDGLYCLRKWVFLGDRNLHLMDSSSSPVVKAGTSSSIELPDEIPEVLKERRAQLGFDYGKFDYVIHDGEALLLDTNSTPGFSKQSARLLGFCTALSAGIEAWYETARGNRNAC